LTYFHALWLLSLRHFSLRCGCLVVALFGLLGCAPEEAAVRAMPLHAEPLVVEVLRLQAERIEYPIQSFGRLVAAEKLTIGVEVAGTVEQVYFREGQRVAVGDKLVSLDNAKQVLRLKRAVANESGAQAALHQSEQSYRRFAALGDEGAVSKDELNKMESNFANAQALLAQSKADKKLAEQALRELVVLSPVDGVIERESVEPGQKVLPGDRLGVLQARGSLQVVTFVNEAEVNQITLGSLASLTVAATHQQQHQAMVESIALTANVDTGNFEVKLRVDNTQGLLREGMSARVELFITSAQPTLIIPRAGVVDRHRKRLVYVVENGVARAREPSFGLSSEGGWTVRSGLQGGEQLIMSPLSQVFDGLAVLINGALAHPEGEATLNRIEPLELTAE